MSRTRSARAGIALETRARARAWARARFGHTAPIGSTDDEFTEIEYFDVSS